MNKKLLDYYAGDNFSAGVWENKYAVNGVFGKEETPNEMHYRITRELARAELKYKRQGSNEKLLSEFGRSLKWREHKFSEGITTTTSSELSIISDHIYTYLHRYKYIIPQGSIMSILGNTNVVGSLSNCFVLPSPADSYGGIFKTDEQIAQLQKRRGGVGLSLSSLRPEGTSVSNAAGSSTGAHSFMDRYSSTTREVAQNGRRGALMLLLDCRHPDVFKFVTKKKDRTKVTGANISVMLTDKFMEAVKKDGDFYCTFPIDNLDIFVPGTRIDYNVFEFGGMKIKAKELYDLIVENAWDNAEPGVAFIDRIHNYSPDGVYGQFKAVASNPCGEIFMGAYDACRLLALNLFNIVKDPFTKKAKIDYKLLYEIAYVQQRLADDIVDLEIEHVDRIIEKIKSDKEPEDIKANELNLWENIRKVAGASRRTGCGFTALADMLAALGLKYDSDEAIKIVGKVMKEKMRAELDCTIDLAIERGPFEEWNPGKEFYGGVDGSFHIPSNAKEAKGENAFYQMLCDEFPSQVDRMLKYGRRNVSFSCVAPTGTVSIVALLDKYSNTSAGIEPQFACYYFRNVKVNPNDENIRVDNIDANGDSWKTTAVVMGGLKEWIDLHHETAKFVGVENLPKEVIEELYKKSPYYKSCANDISWEKRIEIQALVQKYTTHSISSTINLPKDVTRETVDKIYQKAWESGLKGITIYRDGCRDGVLNLEKKGTFEYKDAVKRPKDLDCQIFSTTAKGKKWNVIVGLFEKKPYEVFAMDHFTNKESMIIRKMGKGRYDLIENNKTFCEDITSEMKDEECSLTRLISTSLRHGCDMSYVIQQLNKSCGTVVSFSKAIARTLKTFSKEEVDSKEKCLNCGSSNLKLQEGCVTCMDCSTSKCS